MLSRTLGAMMMRRGRELGLGNRELLHWRERKGHGRTELWEREKEARGQGRGGLGRKGYVIEGIGIGVIDGKEDTEAAPVVVVVRTVDIAIGRGVQGENIVTEIKREVEMKIRVGTDTATGAMIVGDQEAEAGVNGETMTEQETGIHDVKFELKSRLYQYYVAL